MGTRRSTTSATAISPPGPPPTIVIVAGTVSGARSDAGRRRRAAGDDVIMLAGTRAEAGVEPASATNTLAGLLTGPALDVDGRIFRPVTVSYCSTTTGYTNPTTTAAVYRG
jgi:hypothetical protein